MSQVLSEYRVASLRWNAVRRHFRGLGLVLGLMVGPAWAEERSYAELGLSGGLLVTQNEDWGGATLGLSLLGPIARHWSFGGELMALHQDYPADRFLGFRFGVLVRRAFSTRSTRPYALAVFFFEAPGETTVGGGLGLGYLTELGSDRFLLDLQVRGMSRFSLLFPRLTLSATLGVAVVL